MSRPKQAPDQPAPNDPQYRDAMKRYQHTAYHDDFPSLVDRLNKRIAELEHDKANMHKLNDSLREANAELEAENAALNLTLDRLSAAGHSDP